LSLSHQTGYIEEPLNQQTGLKGTDEPFVHLHEFSDRKEEYDRIIKDMVAGKGRYKTSFYRPKSYNPVRLLFYTFFTNRYHLTYKLGSYNPFALFYISKDPTASFSTEYLHIKHGFNIVLTVRHPCAVIASHQRLGWNSPLELFLSKHALRRELSKDFDKLKLETMSEIEKLAWYWRAVYEILTKYAERNSKLLVVEHEEFSKNPLEISKALYEWFGLPFSPAIERKVDQLTGAKNPTAPRSDRAHTLKRNSKDNIDRWKNLLDPADVQTILDITSDTYAAFCKLSNNISHQKLPELSPSA
jgi:hypothetical protein